MAELPTSLSIAWWLVGSLWVVGGIAYVFDFPGELVWAAFVAGGVAGIAEWRLRRRSR